MNSFVKRICVTAFAAAVLLLGWNLHVPNPVIENDHLKNQTVENCAEKQIFSLFNVSIQTIKKEDFIQTIMVRLACIPMEDILYMECYSSIHLDGVQISASSDDTNALPSLMPLLKGKLYQSPPKTVPITIGFDKGDYLLKGYCKNQDGAIILCAKWKFTWV